jgi:5-methyltetrahydropteroyltriglutamate--homocysteine methyltransferase
MTRAMWVKEVSRDAYPSKEALGDDVVRVLREEIGELVALGAAFVQLDEPVLTELVFSPGQPRTFMCAALAARRDPAEELALAVDLVNRVAAGFEAARIGVHVCRGNWSRDETTLLRGGYAPLAPSFARMQVRQLVLEYATERAGDLVALPVPELGLGVVNPRSERVETADEVRRAIERALRLYRPEQLFVNPDCGFATFANRPVNSADIAVRKLAAIVEAVQAFR